MLFKLRDNKEELEETIKKSKIQPAELALIKIKDVWEKSEEQIIREIERLTGIKISTEKISCTIDPYVNNGFYGYENISVGVYDNLDDELMVISHELFHIFYWRRIRELKLSEGILGKEKPWEWALAEVSAYLLQIEPSLMRFWPNSQVRLYPEIIEVYNNVKDFWKQGDFDSFIVKSYGELKDE